MLFELNKGEKFGIVIHHFAYKMEKKRIPKMITKIHNYAN